MALTELSLKKLYRTKQDDYLNNLIVPALRESHSYDRGSGYFTLDSLSELASGLIPFVRRGGRMRVITSVELNEHDVEVIQSGLELQEASVSDHIRAKILEAVTDTNVLLNLDLITNLIAIGQLTIKIAYMPDGIYHEKIGIMADNDGNKLYFSGSANATVSGLKRNWESVVVLSSWWGDGEIISEQQVYFENLWRNHIDGIEVMDLPEAEKKLLLQKYKSSASVNDAIDRIASSATVQQKRKKTLYYYQQNAIDQFVANDCCHFFEMATGTGKTFTAVQAIVKAQSIYPDLSVVILVPQIDLQEQWKKALIDEHISPLLLGGYANANETEYNFSAFLINAATGTTGNVAISTYDTFFSKYAKKCNAISSNKLIIVDEAHNLSPKQIKSLPLSFRFRLGLSATPERYDPEETRRIIGYFTREKIDTFKYTIEQAIDEGFLSHYLYHPLFVHISTDDFTTYQNYTKKLLYAMNEEPRDQQKIKDILTKRSSIVKKSNSKIDMLSGMIGNYDFRNSVVYCGHGKDYETEESIIDTVTRILAVDGQYAVSQFTANTSDRSRVLSEFENEHFDVLVAIRCFDEGVDVPKLDKIFIMASDALSRQTIQRRGRVLRQCKATGKTIAHIHDFIVLPPEEMYEGMGVRSLVANELKRAFEYSRLADNQSEVDTKLNSICEMYGVVEEENSYEFDAES